jgi:hypothetical protein
MSAVLPYAIGCALAAAVAAFARIVGLDRDRAFYPTVVCVVALYYVLFAVMGGSERELFGDSLIALAFFLVAALGFRRDAWLVVAALAAHGLLDSVHGSLVPNHGVPIWWPGFCLAYDFTAAAFLAFALRRGAPRSMRAAKATS